MGEQVKSKAYEGISERVRIGYNTFYFCNIRVHIGGKDATLERNEQ